MNSRAYECGICSKVFNAANQKPLCLQCGHTFCRKYVKKIKISEGIACPTCNEVTKTLLKNLPVVSALIPSESEPEIGTAHSDSIYRCASHDSELQYLCLDCENLTCWKSSRDFHMNHRVEPIADIAIKDSETESREKIRSKFQAQHEMHATQLSVLQQMIEVAEEMANCKIDFEVCKDLVQANQCSTEKGLADLDSLLSCSSKERIKKLTGTIYQWKTFKIPHERKLNETSEQLDNLCMKYLELKKLLPETSPATSSLQASFGSTEVTELFPDDTRWTVSSNDDVRRAVASVRYDRRPSSLTVVSSAAEPIRMLPEVLKVLGAACLGPIIIKDINSFWNFSMANLQSFFEVHGCKVEQFFGYFEEAVTVVRARGELGVKLCIGISKTDDIEQVPPSHYFVDSVSFNRSLSTGDKNKICSKLQSWKPRSLHFPDLQSGDQVWVIKLLDTVDKEHFKYLYLPRCHLHEDDLRALLKHFGLYPPIIYCEHTSLSDNARERLNTLTRKRNILLHWNIDAANL